MGTRELAQRASQISFLAEEYDIKAHRGIYDEVSRIANDPQQSGSSDIPPALVFYAIRHILHPEFILGQVPDLFNLLTLVDVFRQFAAKKSDDILTWNEYYHNDQQVWTLTEKEVNRIKYYQASSPRLRKEYFLLLKNLCMMYIHYLWTSPESCLLALRLNDFFPGSLRGAGQPSSLLFHVDLDEDERQAFTELKEECSMWMKAVVKWETEREKLGEQGRRSTRELEDSFQADFLVAFPPPVDHAVLLGDVEKYIQKVEGMVRKLEEWFPPSQVV